MFYTSTGYIISKDLKILINYGLVFHTTAATLPKKQIWRRIYASENDLANLGSFMIIFKEKRLHRKTKILHELPKLMKIMHFREFLYFKR